MYETGSWSTELADSPDEWIQADFGESYLLSKIITQGRQSTTQQWVTSYNISYSQDGDNWVHIPIIYQGNTDRSTKVINELPSNITARYVQLRPQTWNTWQSLRWDVIACPAVPGKFALMQVLNFSTCNGNWHWFTRKRSLIVYNTFLFDSIQYIFVRTFSGCI